MEIGVIIHIGPYSVPAFDSDPRRRRTQNGSEWYYKRLIEKGTFHPTSGWKETQAFHATTCPDVAYAQFADQINFGEAEVETWIQQAVMIKAGYVIITSRHHDGFCMWPSQHGPHVNVDVVGLVARLACAAGLRFGIYYSWLDWDHGMSKKYLETIVRPQLMELTTMYNPDIWWFDGDWTAKSGPAVPVMAHICAYLKTVNPHVEMNDRGTGTEATYHVFGDRHIPPNREDNWEHVNTIGYSWGYNRYATDDMFKSGQQLFDLYTEVRAKGGKFLINLGPSHEGYLDPRETVALTDFATYLDYSPAMVLITRDEAEVMVTYLKANPDDGYAYIKTHLFTATGAKVDDAFFLGPMLDALTILFDTDNLEPAIVAVMTHLRA